MEIRLYSAFDFLKKNSILLNCKFIILETFFNEQNLVKKNLLDFTLSIWEHTNICKENTTIRQRYVLFVFLCLRYVIKKLILKIAT